MLKLTIPGEEFYDEVIEQFSYSESFSVELEHSLVSVSKWESFFEKPFLSTNDKTNEEVLSYVKFMILDEYYPENILERLSNENLKEINQYIESAQSATTFGEMPQKKARGEVITAELIYYFMVAFNIPFECETWHLNRLFSLIRICNIKNSKEKPMSRAEISQRNRELNDRRRAELNTSG